MKERQILEISGPDRVKFVDSLITNSISGENQTLKYAALLTPQGKYLFDFFVLRQKDRLLIDICASAAEAFEARLRIYKLRAAIEIRPIECAVILVQSADFENAFPDPRHPSLGARLYCEGSAQKPPTKPLTQGMGDDSLLAKRVEHVIPESGIELIANQTYILEAGFERLNGVDFKKGCFVGQEIVARMKYKTTLKKGLCRVAIPNGENIPPQTALQSGGKEVGYLGSTYADKAIAHLHFDRVRGAITADSAEILLDWRP